ncbi:NAD(P)H-dependent oxidoreductase [Flagellimonas hymeniacidonis]|uniref:NAD(P)H-dependent oxidoreductase n=1 Tax=Flagellimonas hymeniacidonis TaxID=2603628 RepID=A0A5C8V8H9_9FLAO|nr:NAD(P)H-dependent oxidoreductase [Flagellimonas hymeniacidonis]TXN38255.1 NAD(P)H-dependent oxidoreductase [Flagellimonas hymeniacidonis]
MRLVENLKWRYATKKFDSGKIVSEQDLDYLKEAVQLSVSSYGLQLYKVLIIEDKALRARLKEVSWGQSQVTEASHLFVFCNFSEHKEERIDDYINNIVKTQQIPISEVQGYGDFIKESLSQKNESEWQSWSKRQTYLSLANLLSACAELKIDACPMEGFDPKAYNEILGLDKRGLNASVIATVGYRSEKDATQYRKKVRKTMEELFETV